MARRQFRKGDRVRWDTSQGPTTGRVEDVATEPGRIKGFEYEASRDDPKYIVRSEKSDARAAHSGDELRRA